MPSLDTSFRFTWLNRGRRNEAISSLATAITGQCTANLALRRPDPGQLHTANFVSQRARQQEPASTRPPSHKPDWPGANIGPVQPAARTWLAVQPLVLPYPYSHPPPPPRSQGTSKKNLVCTNASLPQLHVYTRQAPMTHGMSMYPIIQAHGGQLSFSSTSSQALLNTLVVGRLAPCWHWRSHQSVPADVSVWR